MKYVIYEYEEGIKQLFEKYPNLKQKDIAKLIHVSPRTYSHYENNEREMSLDTWKLLSKLLEKSIDYLSIIEEKKKDKE